jgi:hypothetical protein
MSIRMKQRLPLDGFSSQFKFGSFTKICWHNSILAKIGWINGHFTRKSFCPLLHWRQHTRGCYGSRVMAIPFINFIAVHDLNKRWHHKLTIWTHHDYLETTLNKNMYVTHIFPIYIFTAIYGARIARDGLDGRGIRVRAPVGAWFFPSPRSPDRFWGPTNLLSNEYGAIFPRW